MPVARTRAEKMVAGLAARAEQMNADPRYLHQIHRLAVFGSFLTAKPTLGDLDIGADFSLRAIPKTEEEQAAFHRQFPAPAYIMQNWFARMFWPEQKFVRDLRAG